MGFLCSGVRGAAAIAVGPELRILFHLQGADSPRKSTGQGRGTDAQVAYRFSMMCHELRHTQHLGSPLTWHLRFCGSEVRTVWLVPLLGVPGLESSVAGARFLLRLVLVLGRTQFLVVVGPRSQLSDCGPGPPEHPCRVALKGRPQPGYWPPSLRPAG